MKWIGLREATTEQNRRRSVQRSQKCGDVYGRGRNADGPLIGTWHTQQSREAGRRHCNSSALVIKSLRFAVAQSLRFLILYPLLSAIAVARRTLPLYSMYM